jgi:hypothetical protein
MIARLALVAALAGSGVGAAVVLADDARDERPAVPVVAAAATPTPAPGNLNRVRDVQIVRTVEDPAGGLPWAIRRFSARSGNVDVDCRQLGRLEQDRFGWVGADGVFKVRPPEAFELAGACTPANQERKFGIQVGRFTAIADLTAPRPLVTVTWGVTAPTTRAVLPAGEPALPVEDGLLLHVVKGEGPNGSLTGELEDRSGRRTPFNRIDMPGYRGEKPVAGTDRVEVQTPDPGGGEPWALLAAEGSRGGQCLSQPGRLVGSRLGHVDRGLGVFYTSGLEVLRMCPRRDRKPTRAYPMRITTGIWGAGFADPRGRVERRVDPTRIVFDGTVHRDVQTVTIRTPRDVRTLVPSAKAHAILAVYDGRFPGGSVTATARMKDGREVTRTLYVE